MRPDFLRNELDDLILDAIRRGLKEKADELTEGCLSNFVDLVSGSMDMMQYSDDVTMLSTPISDFWFGLHQAIRWAAPVVNELYRGIAHNARPEWERQAHELLKESLALLKPSQNI